MHDVLFLLVVIICEAGVVSLLRAVAGKGKHKNTCNCFVCFVGEACRLMDVGSTKTTMSNKQTINHGTG